MSLSFHPPLRAGRSVCTVLPVTSLICSSAGNLCIPRGCSSFLRAFLVEISRFSPVLVSLSVLFGLPFSVTVSSGSTSLQRHSSYHFADSQRQNSLQFTCMCARFVCLLLRSFLRVYRSIYLSLLPLSCVVSYVRAPHFPGLPLFPQMWHPYRGETGVCPVPDRICAFTALVVNLQDLLCDFVQRSVVCQ